MVACQNGQSGRNAMQRVGTVTQQGLEPAQIRPPRTMDLVVQEMLWKTDNVLVLIVSKLV